ncbi:MAG: helix-turn-helix domain-containing protein [Actinocatenispora sp.]
MRTVNPAEHARKRASIVHAAAVEFAAHGVDGTSTAAICRRAGIGSGTLFHYFATKRDVFHAVFGDDLPRNADVCRRALAAEAPDAGLDLLLDHLLGDLADPLAPGLAAAAVFQANRDAAFAEMLATDDERTRATLTTLLERMAGGGRRLAFPPDRVARWIQSLLDASYLSADEPGHDVRTRIAELRRIVAWLAGGDPA